jgi:hypothetical protein
MKLIASYPIAEIVQTKLSTSPCAFFVPSLLEGRNMHDLVANSDETQALPPLVDGLEGELSLEHFEI